MRRLVADPPAAFASINGAAISDLEVTKASYKAGAPIVSGTAARVPVTEHLTIPGFGVWTVHTTLHLVERSGRWLVQWTPETIDPSLRPASQFALTATWPPRAPILGAGNVALTAEEETVTVGIEGKYVKDPSSLSAALVAAGATSAEASAALATAKVKPAYFEPVFTVSWARYLQLKPTLYPLPGTVFQTSEAREAVTPGLEAHLVGSVGPITAQELHALGAPYDTTSVVGQTGLEQYDQAQLAGTPGTTISVVSDDGSTLATLASKKPVPGTPVRTSINPTVQRAAEAALAHEDKPAALVAVDASTGQLLASVSDPSSDAFDQAFDGTFPPGSTFKTITSTALIEHGLSPSSSASCPTTITVGGELFHNAEGDAPVQNMAQAFTESCNTAFIGLTTKNLDPANLPAAAAEYDVGTSPDIGLTVFGGSVPTPTSAAGLAATAIGQGSVLVSPLDMAMVAAAIDSGVVREPRLVLGAPDDRAPTHRLPTDVVDDLHVMMADVVASGTAANQGLPSGTYAKTGTAEYGSGNPLPTDAWLIGFRGNVAFAVLVVDGGYGGPTDGPIAASFLNALGTSG
ncbi:MAG TPA: penicillin-binding transpeptidase domain-containing protein [Acidimicrobiales bacterium]|nr:penicillin-binding transpeptidase domain-containing protein [Acidimicrobiales bacterium]